eukprot:XP_014781336.1 PREDICTED: RNA polymerase II elongation factor ELL-like [Octopus bimaculoides]
MSTLEKHPLYTMSTSCEDDKTIIHAVFTESILGKLQDFLRNATESCLHPTIKIYNDGTGFIQIPVCPLETDSEQYTFHFNLYCVQGKVNGVFYCLQQVLSKNENCISSLGCITHKLVMQGNRDSFKEFRKRMHVEEAKKKPAKEICLSKNLKYNKFLSHSDNEVSNFNASLCDGWNNKALISDNLSGESSFSLSNDLHIPSYVRKSSLRKRIIHLLALRPYNKCELLRLLKRHGISENDKKSFEFKLSEVSTCYKRQRFTLTIPAWKEVDAAWPYYRVEQQQLVRRRLNAMYRGTSDRPEEHFHSTDFEFLEKKPISNNGLHTLNLNNKQKFLQSALCPETKYIRRFKERCQPNVLEDVEKHYHSISEIQSSFPINKNMRIPISETIESKQKPWSFSTLACLVMAEDNSVVELRLGASFDPNPRVAFHSVR